MKKVTIIDGGGANIASLRFAFDRLGVETEVTTDANTIRNADRVLLPGVGAARDAMARLHDAKLVDVIRNLDQPVLGICLGMQLLCDGSEEEDVECLGIIPGSVTKLNVSAGYPVPNMGWCATNFATEHPLLERIDNSSYFYYLHSYALPASTSALATASHAETFSAVVGVKNFVGTQFHPERSSVAGARLLSNFLKMPA